MADWNTEYDYKTWSSMWLFLKGIEGFDNKRARLYLGQLLDKNYDTVSVLKLATKQDLVEDAGILPGDALRIVAAAKQVVSRRVVDDSESPQQSSKLGGVVSSESPPVQETKAVAQESLERTVQDEGNQTSPRQEIIKQAQNDITIRYPRPNYACGLCQITCNSEYTLRLHFKGRKHAEMMEDGTENNQHKATNPIYYCSICDVRCTCKKNLVMHFKGKKHQACMEEEDSDDELAF